MRHAPLGKLALAIVAVGLTGAVGCQSDGSSASVNASAAPANERGGRVIDRSQGQTVNPDGSAVRTRTQLRQTPSGATIQETQTERREVVDPAGTGSTVGGGEGYERARPAPGGSR